MAKRDDATELSRVYEGAAALGELLGAAGSDVTVEDVKVLFQQASADDMSAGEVIPDLFDGEPRFSSPEVARRLYGNLFGLWDRVAAGLIDEPKVREEKPKPPPAVPPPPAIEGSELSDAFVEHAFRSLTTLHDRDRQRLKDRFEQRESELPDALHALALAPEAEAAGLDLSFELWAMAEWALGTRVGRATFTGLRQKHEQSGQPALDRYVEEWLGEAELDEVEPLSKDDRQKLEPFLRALIVQLAPVAKAASRSILVS